MRSKYNIEIGNKEKRTYDGITFDSELELKYYKEVICKGLEQGNIKNFERQKSYELQPTFRYNGKTIRAVTYVADFVIEYSDGKIEVIDIKGFADTTAVLKKKLFMYKYPDVLYKWISYSKTDGGWIEYDELKRKRTLRKKRK